MPFIVTFEVFCLNYIYFKVDFVYFTFFQYVIGETAEWRNPKHNDVWGTKI